MNHSWKIPILNMNIRNLPNNIAFYFILQYGDKVKTFQLTKHFAACLRNIPQQNFMFIKKNHRYENKKFSPL